jgi:hypothetical protein
MKIPHAALGLGLAGLLPFLGGGLLALWQGASEPIFPVLLGWVPGRGDALLVHYGQIILCFMSGVLWGFATRGEPRHSWRLYTLSVLPALWVLFATGHRVSSDLGALIAGFGLLLMLDRYFWQRGLTPEWWMRLRVLLTAGVLACLCLPLVFLS